MLTISNLSKSFGNLRALNSVSLTVPQGKIIGLIGPNGSGKSTLLSLIAGNQRADSGSIRFGDVEIATAAPDTIFRLGLVRSYQDPSLFFRMSVLDNALLPVNGQIGERARNAALHSRWQAQEKSAAQSALQTLEPLKLGAQINKAAADLSGGQMKLLEIGRSLMGNPKLLLLDEPTAGVAPALAYQIFEQIARLRSEQGLTFLIIEHRLEILFDFVDSLYVMHTGDVIAQGTPREIEGNERVREVYLGE